MLPVGLPPFSVSLKDFKPISLVVFLVLAGAPFALRFEVALVVFPVLLAALILVDGLVFSPSVFSDFGVSYGVLLALRQSIFAVGNVSLARTLKHCLSIFEVGLAAFCPLVFSYHVKQV